MQAVRKPATFPLSIALKATCEMSSFRDGATVVKAPMYTPMAAMLPKPQHAYVASTSDRVCACI